MAWDTEGRVGTSAVSMPTMTRVLAYTLSPVVYHRQICSHAGARGINFHEFAKRLAYWFVALAANTS